MNTEGLREKWDARYRQAAAPGSPSRVLSENAHLLPATGDALDLACGLGADALFLARRGFRVSAWDLSPVAVEAVRAQAGKDGLAILPAVRDIVAEPPPAAGFDVILVSYFLERGLAPTIVRALRPGGLLFYQTFTRDAVSDRGPSNPGYRLGRNELLDLFKSLVLRVYREEGRLGDTATGCRDLALLVAQRPVD